MIVQLNSLTKNELIHILKDLDSSITKEYIELFKADGIDLEFDDDSLNAIAEKAMFERSGARGIRSIVSDIMQDSIYDIFSSSGIKGCRVTRDTVDSGILEITEREDISEKIC